MSPKVSVVMSVCNGEKYLREAIDSILDQTFTDFEFIIINDGSTDGTREILESYSDSRIFLLHQKNVGLTKSLNKGLKMVRGEYIARQDADDISFPNRLERQIAFLDKNPEIAMVGSACVRINHDGKYIDLIKYPTDNESIKTALLKFNPFWHTSILIRKRCLDKVGYYREFFKFTQDYDLWLRISEKYKVANIAEPLVKYRFELNSITVNKLEEQLLMRDLARKMALERKEKGTDRFLVKSYEDQIKLSSIADRNNYQKEVETILRNWIKKLTDIGETKTAQSLAIKLVKNNPKKIKSYNIYLKSLRNYIMGTLLK